MTTINTKVIADSISLLDDRITTILITCPYNTYIQLIDYPIFTNAILYKNKTNLNELINQIDNDIALPISFKKNTNINLTKPLETSCIFAIKELWNNTKKSLEVFDVEQLNIDVISNYLHPFQHIELLVTSTNWWDNFLILETDNDEINELISQIRLSLNKSYPILKREDEWHLPFIYCDEDPVDLSISYKLDHTQLSLEQAKNYSVLKCLNSEQSNQHDKALNHIARPLTEQEFNDNLELINFIKKRKIMWNNPNSNGWVTYRQELELT